MTHWRDRHLEKNLLHNRQAKSLHKHFVSLERLEGDFRCEQCPKTNKNLSKFLDDSCGGAVDQNREPGRRRTSIVLTQREKIASEHHAVRTTQHLLTIPTEVAQLPSCSLCGCEQKWEGWERIRRFLRETCSQAGNA